MPIVLDGTDAIGDLGDALASKAPLASPTFTGTPAAPTAANGTNTTQIATTAFVLNNSNAGLQSVVPTSIANSGGSATVSGNAVTFSGVTSVSLNGVFSANFDTYRILVRAIAAAGSPVVCARMRLSGTDSTAASYNRHGYSGGSSASNVNNVGMTEFILMGANATTHAVSAFDMFAPALAAPTSYVGNNFDPNGFWSGISSVHAVSTAYDGLTVFTNASTISGQIIITGYRK